MPIERHTLPSPPRLSNVNLTIKVFIKSVAESEVSATDVRSARLEKEITNNFTTAGNGLLN
jgi:hypothetical protein